MIQLFAIHHHREPWDAHGRGPAALVIFHGHGEHGGRYLHVPHYLKDRVNSVYCPDWRGHGRSEGLRGHLDRFEQYTDDGALIIRRLDEQLKRRFGSSEIHLLGHSMGGLIALKMLFDHPTLPVRSATISAPWLALKEKPPTVKRLAGRVLSGLYGSIQLNSGLDASKVSHDPSVVNAYVSDRLVHSKITPRLYTEIQGAISDVLSRREGIHPPVQFIVPLADEIIDPETTLRFARELRHPDKRIKTYEGFYHESFNEGGGAADKARAFEDLTSWIEKHQTQRT